MSLERIKAELMHAGGSVAGKHFHSFNKETGAVRWQGRVLSYSESGDCRLQLYEWMLGTESDVVEFDISDMTDFVFYDTREQMITAYDRTHRNMKFIGVAI